MQSIAGGENYEKQAPVVLLDKGTDPAHCSSLHTQTHIHTAAEGWVGYESLGRCLVGAALAGRELWADCVLPQQITHRAQHTGSNHALN